MSLLGVVAWDPVITGYLAVLISVVVLCGSVYLLLATNLGARLGFLVAWTGLWGWNLLMGLIWWVFGIGWIGPGPQWDVVNVATDLRAVPVEDVQELAGVDVDENLPEGWTEFIDSDAQSTADGQVACAADDVRRTEAVNTCFFTSPQDYQVHRVLEYGGERYRPLGLPDNVVTQYFIPSRGRPHYAVVQLQAFQPQDEIDPNNPVIEPAVLDESAPVYSVVMIRDQGSKRLRPALATIFSGLLFALGCYHLHRRDQAVWAVEQASGGSS